MQVAISRKQAEQVGFEQFMLYGHEKRSWGWRGNEKVMFDLRAMEPHKVEQFAKMLITANERVGGKGIYGLKQVLRDIDTWKQATSGVKNAAKLRHLRDMESQLIVFMQNVPGHRVYRQHDGLWLAYYVEKIWYEPEKYIKGDRWTPGYTKPAEVNIKLAYDHGVSGHHTITVEWLGEHSVTGQTLVEVLTEENVFPETPELRARYEKEHERFKKWFFSIGKQLLANGDASYETEDEDKWWRKQTRHFKLKDARVVVDVLKEGEQGEDESDDDDDGDSEEENDFWKTKVVNAETGEEEEVGEPFERPVHPYLKVFHLAKHMNLVLHVSYLRRYKYDTKMIKKLVIDEERKALVKLLVNHRESKYADIIGEKGGGAIVLLSGSPGTGKTLTAEVFAESEKRALYTVQCAQLGTTAEELEDELLKVMARAQRWNAVLLLDECDVYVRKRGKDIVQNAIVGVFLRVLEYQNAVMFLTTNRAKDIDDAVASRCIAKLVYSTPDYDSQVKIWQVLVGVAGATMSEDEIRKVAKEHPDLSGRDVKNLLKLAMLVSNDAITAKAISFVKQFKPT